MSPRIGELFAGYGGLGAAVQAVYGGTVAWYSEFDAAPSKIMAHHHPDAPNYGDITAIAWDEVEPVDILTGGFPCQDVSVAGRRAGMIDGTRSGLWSHMAHAIDVLRPPLVIIENVGGLFSAQAASIVEPHPICLGDSGTGSDTVLLRAIDAVLSTLSELGYDAEWTALRASDVGAPHGRLRVFITAHPADPSGSRGGRGGAVPLAGGQGGPDASPVRADAGPVPPGDAPRLMPTPSTLDSVEARTTYAGGNPTLQGAVGGVSETDAARHERAGRTIAHLPTPRAADGMAHPLRPHAKDTSRLEDAVAANLLPTPGANLGSNGGPQHPDKRRAGGHSVSIEDAVHGLLPTPVASEHKGHRTNASRQGGASLTDALLPTPRALDATGVRGRTPNRSDAANARAGLTLTDATRGTATQWGEYAAAIERWETVTGRPAPAPTEPGKNRPRLAARFVEWMMGLDDGHVTDVPGLTRNQHLKALGNGVVPQQGAAAIAYLDHVRRTVTP